MLHPSVMVRVPNHVINQYLPYYPEFKPASVLEALEVIYRDQVMRFDAVKVEHYVRWSCGVPQRREDMEHMQRVLSLNLEGK